MSSLLAGKITLSTIHLFIIVSFWSVNIEISSRSGVLSNQLNLVEQIINQNGN